jgi:hypothetical protein
MAYAPSTPSTVGSTALQAIRGVAPERQPMPTATQDEGSLIHSDMSNKSIYYGDRSRALQNPAGIVFHHTAGRGTPEGVMAALNAQKYAVHYIIDRDGRIHQSLPTSQYGIHTGVSQIPGIDNRSTLGVEIIANNDQDVTPAQIEASRRLYAHLQSQYPKMQAYGHGELSTNRLPDEGYRAVMAIRGPEGQWRPSGGRSMPNVPVNKRTLTTYRTGEFKNGGETTAKVESAEALDAPKPQPSAPNNVQWRFEEVPSVFNAAPTTQPSSQTDMPGTIAGSIGTQVGGGRLSAYGGVNPDFMSLPKSPEKTQLVFPSYGVSWKKSFKQGGTVTEKALMVLSRQAKRQRGRPD